MPTTRGRKDRGRSRGAFAARGFTLIELVVVVFVLGLVAALGRPALNSSVDSAILSSAAGEVAAALDYARMTASSDGRPCRVTVDAPADTLGVEQLRSAVDFADPGLSEILRTQADAVSYVLLWHPVKRGHRYSLDFAGATALGKVDVVTASFGGGGSVVFDGTGDPSDGGTVVLERGGRIATVTLDGLTGKVTRSD